MAFLKRNGLINLFHIDITLIHFRENTLCDFVFWAIWLIIWPFSKSKVTKAQFFCLGFTFFEFSLRVHLSKLRLANITKNLYLVIFWIRISRVYSSRSLCKDSYLKETKYVGDSILSDEKTGKFLNYFEIFREFA